MKKVINVGIGKSSFIINEDAYQRLSYYLSRFKEKAAMGPESEDVMEDLEMRISELFSESITTYNQVITLEIVNRVIMQLGMPDGSTLDSDNFSSSSSYDSKWSYVTSKKLYRDPDGKSIAGVCSGLSLYFNIDVVLIRILFVIAFIMGSAGFWAYIIFWIVAPMAITAAQKCEMRGLPITAENLKKFSTYKF